ncbi:hypothetical protein NHH03_13020 [Stieleria sp. TO1_6]|nr:hypothetical protein [Stieleria tagensis]
MTPRKILMIGLLGLAVLPIALAIETDTAAQNPAPVPENLFEGKIVTVYLDDPLKGSGQVMKDAHLETIGGRWVLLGTGVSTGQAGEWDDGLTVGISWDSVTAFYVFTQAQFDEKIKGARS